LHSVLCIMKTNHNNIHGLSPSLALTNLASLIFVSTFLIGTYITLIVVSTFFIGTYITPAALHNATSHRHT